MKHPCDEGLTPACFAAAPEWAKQAFAVRLMSAVIPPSISRRLPKFKFSTLMMFPPGWQPGDPVTPGIIVAPGATFPPGWQPGDPVTPGIIVAPGATFPPGWQPGDDLPDGITWQPTAPPTTTGPTVPIFLDPAAPGPKPAPGEPPEVETKITINSEIGDGWMYHRSFDWSLLITSPTGTYLGPSGPYRYNVAGWRQYFTDYELNRAYIAFDLSAIPPSAGIKSCVVRVYPYENAEGNVSIVQGTWVDPLSLADWDAFTGSPFSTITWALDAYNDFTLNSAGRNFIKSKFGSRAAFCLREYDHDVMAIDPGWPPGSLENGMRFSETDFDYHKPKIRIIYTT